MYDGSWIADRKEGQGTYFYNTTNERYFGDWKDGERFDFLKNMWLFLLFIKNV
jgi:hypothetical protein